MKTKLKKWKKVSSKVLLKNDHFTVYHDVVRLPTGQLYDYYFTNKRGKASFVLPIDDKGRILLAKEFRYPIGKVVYGAVGGSVDKGETPLQAAKREMAEESGYTAKSVKLLGTFYGNPGRSGVTFYTYVARGLTPHPPQQEFGEFIETEFVTVKKLRLMIKNGAIVDPYLMTSFLLYSNQ